MKIPLCVHAGPPTPDRWRTCALGKGVAGKCRVLVECKPKACAFREEPAADAPEPTRVPLALVKCAHLGERLPGEPCGSQLLRCKLHADVTTRFTSCAEADRCCATCADRTAEGAPQ